MRITIDIEPSPRRTLAADLSALAPLLAPLLAFVMRPSSATEEPPRPSTGALDCDLCSATYGGPHAVGCPHAAPTSGAV